MSENPDPAATTSLTSPADPATPADPASRADPAGPGVASPAVPARPADTVRRPAPRIRTMVLGLILLVVAGCILIAQLTDISVDPGVVALGVMVVAGVLLIAGARRSS